MQSQAVRVAVDRRPLLADAGAYWLLIQLPAFSAFASSGRMVGRLCACLSPPCLARARVLLSKLDRGPGRHRFDWPATKSLPADFAGRSQATTAGRQRASQSRASSHSPNCRATSSGGRPARSDRRAAVVSWVMALPSSCAASASTRREQDQARPSATGSAGACYSGIFPALRGDALGCGHHGHPSGLTVFLPCRPHPLGWFSQSRAGL